MKVVLIHNYKGGSGKSLFALNLANYLSSKKKEKTLLIEADFLMPSFLDILGNHRPTQFFDDFLLEESNSLENYIYPNTDDPLGIVYCNNNFMNIEKLNNKSYEEYYDMIGRFKDALESLSYDWIVIDLSPGFHFFVVNALIVSTDIYLIFRPDKHSFDGIVHLLDHIYAKSVNVLKSSIYVIINQIIEHPKMREQVNKWKNILTYKYDFIKSIYEIGFEKEVYIKSSVGEYEPLINSLEKYMGDIVAEI